MLVYGEDPLPDGVAPWIFRFADGRGGCYVLTANGEIRDGRMAFSLGFSLPLAEDFDSAGRDGPEFIDSPAHCFCLNTDGEVTALR